MPTQQLHPASPGPDLPPVGYWQQRPVSPNSQFPPIKTWMDNDPILGVLLLLLGAQISYVLDEIFKVTPRVYAWLERLLS
jgi:hypothetical protein